jgi:hypothetical protein
MLSLHPLQLALVYVNTLMIQQILAEPAWSGRLNSHDPRGITPLVYEPRQSLRQLPPRPALQASHRSAAFRSALRRNPAFAWLRSTRRIAYFAAGNTNSGFTPS